MNGKFLIDGLNSWDNFGMFVADDGYKDLLVYAPSKEVNISNFREVDGITAVFDKVYLKNKPVNINFAIIGSVDKYKEFINVISNKAYHEFNFIDLGITEKLRFVAEKKMNHNEKFNLVTIEFSDDFPFKKLKSYSLPTSNIPKSNIEIGYYDEQLGENVFVNLSSYGIRSLNGLNNQVHKNSDAKKATSVQNREMTSVFYPNDDIKFNGKDITLNLLMKAKNQSDFWAYYREFQRLLCYDGIKKIYIYDTDVLFWFYYLNSNVIKFSNNGGRYWLVFSIMIRILDYVLPSDFILQEEDVVVDIGGGISYIKEGRKITTENLKYIKVEL
jgi:hypothetical protein